MKDSLYQAIASQLSEIQRQLRLAEAALVVSEHVAQPDDDGGRSEVRLQSEAVYAVSNSFGSTFFVTHDRKAMRKYIEESASYPTFGGQWHVSRLTVQSGDNGYGLRNTERNDRLMTAREFMDRG